MNGLFRSFSHIGQSHDGSGVGGLQGYKCYQPRLSPLIQELNALNQADLRHLVMYLTLRKRALRDRPSIGEHLSESAAPEVDTNVVHEASATHIQLQSRPMSSSAPSSASSSPITHSHQSQTYASAVSATAGRKLYQCRQCSLVLSSASNRARHERKKHSGSGSTASGESQAGISSSASRGLKRSASDAQLASEHPPAMDASANVESDELDDALPESAGMAIQQLASAPGRSSSESESIVEGESGAAGYPSENDMDLQEDASSGTDAELSPNKLNLLELASEQQSPAANKRKGGQNLDPAAIDIVTAERDREMQAACGPFLQWLCQGPMTAIEAQIKARRVSNASQLTPTKFNLRFVFGVLLDEGAMEHPDMEQLGQLSVCQQLARALDARNVGSARIYQVFLLVKKALVFLASRESAQRKQFITPDTYSSYMFVDSVCAEASQRRKQEARNRSLLGVQSSKALHKSQSFKASESGLLGSNMSLDAFAMPSIGGMVSLPPNSQTATPAPKVSGTAAAAAASLSAAASAPGSSQQTEESPNEMSPEQLSMVANGSLAYLRAEVRAGTEGALFVHHLVTALLCLGMAPRTQVLQQLSVGTSLIKESDGCYWVRMLAEQNKNAMPTCFALAQEATEPLDYYLQTLRPKMLNGKQHDYVFFKRNGTGPRKDFATFTTTATTQLIQTPKNPHAFRGAVVTGFYGEPGVTQHDMDNLARIMAHTPATARSHYYRPQMAQAALKTNERMRKVLQLDLEEEKAAQDESLTESQTGKSPGAMDLDAPSVAAAAAAANAAVDEQ